MKRIFILAAFLVAFRAQSAAADPAHAQKPNVVLILRADDTCDTQKEESRQMKSKAARPLND